MRTTSIYLDDRSEAQLATMAFPGQSVSEQIRRAIDNAYLLGGFEQHVDVNNERRASERHFGDKQPGRPIAARPKITTEVNN